MRIICLFIFCLLSVCSFSQQYLQIDFEPLKSTGVLPEIFTKPINETVEEEIRDLNKIPDSTNQIKSELLTASNYAIASHVKSGNTLINDEITIYLNSIVDIILKNQPELRKKINVYASKSPIVNATAFYNGTVFVDLGLIAHAKNEAQIAYVLCHEITHYIKQHSVSGWVYNEQLESSSEGKTNEDIFKEKCHYSKDQESEADSLGFYLLKATDYDVNQTQGLFDILQYSHLPFDMQEFNKSFFETENFIIPDKYQLKKVDPVNDNSDKDDSESTHPNTSKRKLAIAKLIEPNSTGRKYILGETQFNYIRELARFEVCRLYLRYRDYNAALYSAYLLAKLYPDNLFLTQTISKCLYAISLYHTGYLRYNKDSYLDGPIHYLQVESYPQQLYYLINKLPEQEWNILSLNYVFRKHKKFPNDQVLSAISDSLIKKMYYVNAEFETGGTGNIVINNINPNIDTTSWFKKTFLDLFLSDKEFTDKFPKTIGNEFVLPYEKKSYHVNRFNKKMRIVENIGIVMCLNPLYMIFDKDEKQTDYLEADIQKNKLIHTINKCAEDENFHLVILDPGLIKDTDVSKLNDFSIITDWLKECSDGDDNEKLKVPVFSTDELTDVINRYQTSHVLRLGIAELNGQKKEYVVFSVIYDLKKNKQVFIKQELFKGSPSEKDLHLKVCSLFDELKNGQ